MKSKLRILRAGGFSLLLSVVLCMSLTGCGTSSDFVLPHRNLLQPDIHFMPYAQVKDGGALKLPLSDFPANFNYNEVNGNNGDTFASIYPTTFRPFLMGLDGSVHLNRDYFTDISEKIIHGKQTLIYTINPKAQWSNGLPITWHDFAVEAHALSGKDPHYTVASSTGYNQIESLVRGKDDRQFIITMRKPLGEWKTLLFYMMYPASVQDTPEKFNTALVNHIPPSAGPFMVDSIDPIRKVVVLKRNPHWWGKSAKLDSIQFTALSPTAGIEPYITHEVDALNLQGDVNKIQRALKTPHTVVRRGLSNNYDILTFNDATKRITHDIHIRYAIAKAIDRSFLSYELNRVIFGKDSPVLNNHFFLAGEKGYQDNAAGFNYDPTAAKNELESDGWKLGRNGIRHKNGKSLTVFYLDEVGVNDRWHSYDEIIQAYLKAVGIRMIIHQVPTVEFLTDIDEGRFDITSFAFEQDNSLVSSALSIFYYDSRCDNKLPVYNPVTCNIQRNYGLQGNTEINKKFDQAITISDDNMRIAAANAIDKLLWKDMRQLPIIQAPKVLAMDSRIVNYGVQEIGDIDWTKVGWMR